MINQKTKKLKPYKCARDLYQDGIFLDANENPYNICGFNRYPDPYARALKKELSAYVRLPQKYVFCGNGSDEIIGLLFRSLVEPEENIIINQPTYGMYKVVADINNLNTKSVSLNDNFGLDLKAINNKIDNNTKMIIACSPNNPTGNLLKKNAILRLCRKHPNKAIIIDEAYIEFASTSSLAKEIPKYRNLVILRTLSKAWGLAGLRLGYCVADPSVIAALNKVKAPYNINSLSQKIGAAALSKKIK